ncbi:MAG: DMT family transporter [Magnetovibrionaceae bacterium]
MDRQSWFLLVFLALLWGGSFFFVEVALSHWPTLTLVFLRVFFGAAALGGYLLVTRIPVPFDPSLWGAFAVMGLLNNVIPFSLIVFGQTGLESGTAAILNATTPLFTVAVAHALTGDEKAKLHKLVGVVFGILGVGVLAGPEAARGLGGALVYQVAILGAALSYSVAAVFGRRFGTVPPPVTAFGMLLASTMVMAPAAFFVDEWPSLAMPAFDVGSLPGAYGTVITLGIACTALAYLIYFRLLARAGATNLMLVTFLVPPGAMALGIIFLGELPTVWTLVGFALIACGLLAVDGRLYPSKR